MPRIRYSNLPRWGRACLIKEPAGPGCQVGLCMCNVHAKQEVHCLLLVIDWASTVRCQPCLQDAAAVKQSPVIGISGGTIAPKSTANHSQGDDLRIGDSLQGGERRQSVQSGLHIARINQHMLCRVQDAYLLAAKLSQRLDS